MFTNVEKGNQGLCKYCGKKLAPKEMLAHLVKCEKRDEKIYAAKKEMEGFFDILITSKEMEDYWMIIEVNEKTMLKEIDTFLREIWLGNEQCLSIFKIKNVKYKYISGGNLLYVEPEQSMYHTLKNILSVGETFDYTYGENKTTEIKLTVFSHRIGRRHEEEDIVLLSRNIPPERICYKCKKNNASWVDTIKYSFDDDAFLCDECKEKVESNKLFIQMEYTENMLPIYNSPRMGIGDYEGSDFYPDEFKPDFENKERQKNKPKKVEKKTLKKFKNNQYDVYPIMKEWESEYTVSEKVESKRELPTKEAWMGLYEVAERIKKFKAWEYVYEFQIISLKVKGEETIFYSILGEDEKEYGVDVYEGYDDFKTFIVNDYSEALDLPKGYVKSLKSNLACRWGNVEDLSKDQRDTIKELGFKYKGKGKWLYFTSFEKGYSPYSLDRDEVAHMTKHLKNLEIILEKFEDNIRESINMDFDELMCVEYIKDNDEWKFYIEKIPLEEYSLSNEKIKDKNKLNRLKEAPKVESVLDVDIIPLKRTINDEKYIKPITPFIYGILDAKSGDLISSKIAEPGADVGDLLVEEIERFIDEVGRPRIIRTANELINSKLSLICENLDINLSLKKSSRVGKKFGEYMVYKKEIGNTPLN